MAASESARACKLMPPVLGPSSSRAALWSWAPTGIAFAIDQGEEARFLAGQKLFDHHLVSGLAKGSFGHDMIDGGESLVFAVRQDNALAGGQTIGLDNDRGAFFMDVFLGGVALVEGGVPGRGNIVTLAEVLHEYLRAFQLGRSSGGTESLDSLRFQVVDKTRDQRSFRTDDDEIDFFRLREVDQGAGVPGGDIDAGGDRGDARVARRAVKFRQRGFRDRPASACSRPPPPTPEPSSRILPGACFHPRLRIINNHDDNLERLRILGKRRRSPQHSRVPGERAFGPAETTDRGRFPAYSASSRNLRFQTGRFGASLFYLEGRRGGFGRRMLAGNGVGLAIDRRME